MHVTRRSFRTGWVLTAGVLLALAGCTTKVTGQPTAAPPPGSSAATTASPDTPAKPGKDAAAARYAAIRAIDPCALHSVEAAAQITDLEPDKIMPGATLSSCDLDMTVNGRELAAWTLTTTIGAELVEDPQEKNVSKQIGGLKFVKLPDFGEGEDQCGYAMPLTTGAGDENSDTTTAPSEPALGLELEVSYNALEAPPKTPCDIATEYLTKVAKYWKNPATRADEVTSPRLRLGDLDPCAGLDSLGEDLGKPRYLDPHSCTIAPENPSTPSGGGSIRVTLGVDDDPRPMVEDLGTEYEAVTVAGRPGVANTISTPNGSFCDVSVVADDQVELQPSQTRTDAEISFQLVNASADSCELATNAAEAVLSTLR